MDSKQQIWDNETTNQFSEDLREMLRSAHDQVQGRTGAPKGITTPRLFLASLYLGKHRQADQPLLLALYKAIGEGEVKQMQSRLDQLGLDGEEFNGLESGIYVGASSFAHQIVQKAVHKKAPGRKLATPIDVVVTLAEKLPSDLNTRFDCGVLVPRDRFFPSELISWLNTVASEHEMPRDLLNRLNALPANQPFGQQPVSRRGSGAAFSNRSLADWQLYLRNQYGADFDMETAALVQDAARAPMSQPPTDGDFALLNTRDFLHPLTKGGPLNGLKLGSFAGSFPSPPPWHEEPAPPDGILTTDTPLGNSRLSFDSHECLRTAASLAGTTPQHPKVTPWHLAVAIVSSKSHGISWQLNAMKSSLDEAAKTLLENMRKNVPALYDEGRWAELLDILGETPSNSTNLEDRAATTSGRGSNPDDPAILQVDHTSKEQLNKFWDRTGIRPGNALSEALAHLCARKQNLPPVTTPGQLLLGLLQRGENLSREAPDSDRTLEVLLVRRLSRHELKLSGLWTKDAVKYGAASKSPAPNPDLSRVLKLSAELEGGCSPGSVYVAPRHFVAALVHLWRQAQIADLKEIFPLALADLEESLKVHLPVFEDKDRQDVWETFLSTGSLPPLPSPDRPPLETEDPVQIGTKSDFSRDSTSVEVDDDTRKLARAIASTFKSARTGDFCFGLFGPWGRGKTTLIREVAGELRDDHVAVPFNAWKYPARPEIWVWLYESIKAQASGTDLWNRLRIGIQSNLRRDPGFGFLLAGFLLLFAAISKGQLTGWLIPLDNLAALLALAALIFYGYRLWNSFGTLLRDYLKMPNHGRHLGLQAAIGDDLKHLLATWTGVERSTNSNPTSEDNSPPSLPTTPWKYFMALIGWHWPFAVGVGLVVTSLVWMLFRVWEPADWPLRVLLIGAVAASLFGFVAVLLPPKRAKQIILIVDDLDRCPPDEMLSVIESLRVFLDDPAISSHLKVAMLLDREILAHAICRKFENLIQANAPKTDRPNPTQDAPARFTRDGIVAEQIEKCFILSFDMPPLASASSWKIASNIVGYTESTEEPDSAAESAKPSARSSDEQEGRRSRSATAGPAERTKPVETTPTDSSVTDHSGSPTQESLEPPPPVKEVHLGEDEKKAMVRLLHSLLTTDPAHATPRRMRMIKMRYYLARQILRAQETPFMPEELLKHFSGICIDRKLDPRLAEVVGMVTGTAPKQ